MSEIVRGKLEVTNHGGTATVTLDGDTASIDVGASGVAGDIVVRDSASQPRVKIEGPTSTRDPLTPERYWGIRIKDGVGNDLVHIGRPVAGSTPTPVAIEIGGAGQPGMVQVADENGDSRTFLRNGMLTMGGKGSEGVLLLHGPGMADPGSPMAGIAAAAILAAPGTLRLAGNGDSRIYLDGPVGNGFFGGRGQDGDIMLFDHGQDDNDDHEKATVHLNGNAGEVRLRNTEGVDRISLNAISSTITVRDDGGDTCARLDGKARELVFFTPEGNESARLTSGGNLWLGGKDQDGDIMLFAANVTDNHDATKATIHIDGNAGDITLRNADCAEDFDVVEDIDLDDVLPGTLMAIAPDGRLRPSAEPYERTVAGVVCGAGSLRPGIILGRTHGTRRLPVALAGRVYCRVDATEAPIRTGDLLTSSARPGVAMRASDRDRAFGAVIGKALSSLTEGEGLIPILVSLL